MRTGAMRSAEAHASAGSALSTHLVKGQHVGRLLQQAHPAAQEVCMLLRLAAHIQQPQPAVQVRVQPARCGVRHHLGTWRRRQQRGGDLVQAGACL